MSDARFDEAKGRAKEAAGSVTDDDELKKEGKADQQAADLKDKVDDIGQSVKDKVDDAKERFGGSDDS